MAEGDEQKKFEITLYISIACGLASFTIFCLIYRRSLFYWWYAPTKKPVNNPLLLSFWKSLVAWIPQAFVYSDKRIWKEKGADAIMHIRFLRICLLLCGMMALFGSAVIIPINIHGTTTETLPDMGYLTISNIDGTDTKLIAHVLFTYFYSFVSYFIIWFYYRKYTDLRKKYLNKNEVKGYSIILRNLPARLRDNQSLRQWFEDHFDGVKVISVRLVWQDKKLRRLRKKRVRYLNKLEMAEQDLEEFDKFKRQWNNKLTELKRKRELREWENSRDHTHVMEVHHPQSPKQGKTDSGGSNSNSERTHNDNDISGAMARGEGKYHNGELLTTSGYLRATMRESNFILTLSGGRLSYDTLPDELELETRPSAHSGLGTGGGGGDKGRDVEGGGGGPLVDPEERRRRKSCCFWFLYEWRKWKWKMKNRTILKHCMGDLKRNSDNVPERLAHLIDEEIASIRYLKAKIAKLTARISAIQANPEKHLPKTGVAFMVFDSMVVPRMTIQPFVAPHEMIISAAPEPNDVSWKTLHPPYWRLLLTRTVVIVGLTLLAIAWAFPAFIFASLANLQSLSEVDGFGWIKTGISDHLSDYAVSVVEGFAPAIFLVLSLVIAKHVIRWIIYRSYEWAKSTVEWKTMTTYWSFLIIHVVFVSTFGGTLSKILSEFIDNPRNLISLLAQALPQNSTFFINYILVVTFCITPLTLFRTRQILQQFVWYVLMRPSTVRQKAKVWQYPTFDYAGSVAQGLLIYTVTLVYSLMAPLISVFGLCYFIVVYLVDRYQIIYTTRTSWQGGATMWPLIFHMFMTSLILFQLAMIGILTLSKFGGGAALVALPFITAGIWVLLHFHWVTVSNSGPINGVSTLKPLSYDEFRKAYTQPSMLAVEQEDANYAKRAATSTTDSSYDRDAYSNDFSDDDDFEQEQERTETELDDSDDDDDDDGDDSDDCYDSPAAEKTKTKTAMRGGGGAPRTLQQRRPAAAPTQRHAASSGDGYDYDFSEGSDDTTEATSPNYFHV